VQKSSVREERPVPQRPLFFCPLAGFGLGHTVTYVVYEYLGAALRGEVGQSSGVRAIHTNKVFPNTSHRRPPLTEKETLHFHHFRLSTSATNHL